MNSIRCLSNSSYFIPKIYKEAENGKIKEEIMSPYNSLKAIFEKIKECVNNLGTDVVEKPNTSSNESYKYHSSERKGRHHQKFLYIFLRGKKHVEILFEAGNPLRYSFYDPKNITEDVPESFRFPAIPKRMFVTLDGLNNGKYTCDDISYLIKQCYDNLDVPR